MELAYYLWKAQEHEIAKVVLLHGMGGIGALWRPVAAGLEKHYSILAPDQRGHGKSRIYPVPGGRQSITYTPLDYGQDLVDTLEALHFYPSWIVGHSMGVRSACALAHLKPEWIKGLVLVDLGFKSPKKEGFGEDLARFIKKLPIEFNSRASAREFLQQNCPDPEIAQYLMATSVTLPGKLTFPFDKSALIQTLEAARDLSIREWIRELGKKYVPILVLRGAQSKVWSHEELEQEKTYFSDLPSIVFEEVEGTGHGLPFQQGGNTFGLRLASFFSTTQK